MIPPPSAALIHTDDGRNHAPLGMPQKPVKNGIYPTFPSTGEFIGFLVAINSMHTHESTMGM